MSKEHALMSVFLDLVLRMDDKMLIQLSAAELAVSLGRSERQTRRDLHDLVDRGLVTWNKQAEVFKLHPHRQASLRRLIQVSRKAPDRTQVSTPPDTGVYPPLTQMSGDHKRELLESLKEKNMSESSEVDTFASPVRATDLIQTDPDFRKFISVWDELAKFSDQVRADQKGKFRYKVAGSTYRNQAADLWINNERVKQAAKILPQIAQDALEVWKDEGVFLCVGPSKFLTRFIRGENPWNGETN